MMEHWKHVIADIKLKININEILRAKYKSCMLCHIRMIEISIRKREIINMRPQED